ncbi:MAG: tRNA (adenosine(37)-N6)-dimethylallyltransferase MiaA [Candidatus Kryptoniota bacterium]
MAENLAIAIVGPTCSGKTRTAIELARLIDGEIISIDARQIYKLVNIGTAKPTREELSEVPHHLVDILSLDDEMSAGDFARLASKTVEEVFGKSRLPIMVGGSGLYLRAAIDGLFDSPEVDEEIRKKLRLRFESEGAGNLLKELQEIDPIAAKGLLPQNYKRILRALEVYYSSGETISGLRQARPLSPDFRTVQFGIQLDRKVLYCRIEKRVDEMIEQGLVDEVKEILRRGFNPNLNSLQTVGYKEVISFLQAKIKFEDMVFLIKMNTRHYAKRQMTWFRKDYRIIWIKADDKSPIEIAKKIKTNLMG